MLMKTNFNVSVSLWTLTVKEVRRFLRIWVQTLVPPAVTMSLYFVIFGSLIGPRIGSMDGFDYIQYMIPGLIMLSVITNSYNNVVSSFYSVKFQKSIEGLLISPMPNWTILLGFVLGGVCRGVLIGIIVFGVSLLFYPNFTVANPALTITVLFLTSVLFSLMGFINAVFADSFDDISIIPTFILTPLIYLGGVFRENVTTLGKRGTIWCRVYPNNSEHYFGVATFRVLLYRVNVLTYLLTYVQKMVKSEYREFQDRSAHRF